MSKFLYFSFICALIFTIVSSENRSCPKHNDISCEESEINKYTKSLRNHFIKIFEFLVKHFSGANPNLKKYLKLVEDARKNYAPCKQTNCACHSDVISTDLSIFKNGITDKLIKNIMSK